MRGGAEAPGCQLSARALGSIPWSKSSRGFRPPTRGTVLPALNFKNGSSSSWLGPLLPSTNPLVQYQRERR
jgi:hypothetical protein